MGRIRGWLKRLERAAGEDAVLIHQRDGSVRAFDKLDVLAALYLARLDSAVGREPRTSEVLDALANATPESRAAVYALDAGPHPHYDDLEDPEAWAAPVEDLSEQP
jgi:hypothetical protein